jgi:cyclopropane fatty-acyl-phospholipid synthase-like methyltransferase
MIGLPYSEACERNKEHILNVLLSVLPAQGRILEIGSCTGQHLVHFAAAFPGLAWQPTDREEYLEGLAARIAAEGRDNILRAVELDVNSSWPDPHFDAVYSANTAHIMSWEMVCDMFAGVGRLLRPGGVFCLYGPFNEAGRYTSDSNQVFDHSLRSRDPVMGIRDLEALDTLARSQHMELIQQERLPANNSLLVFQKTEEKADGGC